MRLASLSVPAITLTAFLGCFGLGCFGPNLQTGQQCSESSACPGDLVCTTDGFCCPAGDQQCQAGTEIDAGIDAEPDAAVPAFTDFEDEYDCAASTTKLLLKFDEANPNNFLSSCGNAPQLTFEQAATDPSGRFGNGVRLNLGSNPTTYIRHNPADSVAAEMTVEAWVQPAVLTAKPAIIASRQQAGATGVWILTATSAGAFQLEVFQSNCTTRFAPIVTGARLATTDAAVHVRATLATDGAVAIYVNGFLQATGSTGPVTSRCASSEADLLVGSLDPPEQAGSLNYSTFAGVIDELRYSEIALNP